ncbi:MAG: LPS export ABC transporter permease LptG [Pseudomonadota bacterium]
MNIFRRSRRWVLPSRTLAWYVGKLTLTRFLAFLIGLVVVLQVLDLMGKSDNILEVDGATSASLVRYVMLRAPQLISQFTPFAALLAIVTVLASLNQTSEIVVMKAAGMSAFHIIAPAAAITLGIAGLHMAFNELVLMKTNAELTYWQDNDYAIDLPDEAPNATRSWVEEERTVIQIGAITKGGSRLVIDGLTLFDRAPSGTLEKITNAAFASFDGSTWKLYEIEETTLPDLAVSRKDAALWGTSVPPERFIALAVKPDRTPYWELSAAIKDLKAEGYPTALLDASLMHKISGPLSTILMPLLGAVAAFGSSRGGQLFVRVVLGMGLGFAFFVADNLLVALGQFGASPPLLSAWAPFAVFALLGVTVLLYTEE